MLNETIISAGNSKYISLRLILVVHLYKKFKAYWKFGFYKGSHKINVPITPI